MTKLWDISTKFDTTVIEDPDGRKYFILNPEQIFDFKPFGRGYGSYGRGGLHVLWFDQHAPTRVGVFTDSLESALEETAGFMKDHYPGTFYDNESMRGFYDDCRKELGPDASEEDVMQCAEEDLTYTESGYLPSDDWGIECDNVEGHPCEETLMDTIAVVASRKLFEEALGFEDVADVVKRMRNTADWPHVADDVPVWGPETRAVKMLKDGIPKFGELISWDTTNADETRHEFLFWKDGKTNELTQFDLVED